MSSVDSAPPMSVTSSTAWSSGLVTPEPSHDHDSRGDGGEATPTGSKRELGAERREVDRAKMPPPPMPSTAVHAPTPPRMVRMPSLSEITSHLHIPSPLSHTTPTAPSRLSLLTSPSTSTSAGTPCSGSATSPTFAPSPSGRLRLPASAMTRTRSGSGASATLVPTLSSLAAITRPVASASGSAPGASMERSASASASRDSHALAPALGGQAGSTLNSPEVPSGGSLRKQPSREFAKGYNEMPSLATIRQRVSFSNGSDSPKTPDNVVNDRLDAARPGQAKGGQISAGIKPGDEDSDLEMVETLLEDLHVTYPASGASTVAASGVATSSTQHPLQHAWTLYFDAKAYMPPLEQSAAKDGGRGMGDYEKSLLNVGKIDTVESFARHMNNLRLPSRLKQNSNYHLFKGDIRPMWEDPANSAGGKWVILFRQAHPLLDIAWANLTMALVGQILDPDDIVCGIVASNRPKVDRLQVWTRGTEDVEALNALGRRCLDAMGLEQGEMESVSVEFQYNASNAHPPANAFMHIPFPSRNFSNSPSTPGRLGTASPAFGGPSPGSGSSAFLTPSPGSFNPSPHPSGGQHHPVPLPLNPRAGNLSINVPPPPFGGQHHSSSPLSATYSRGENRPISPGITPTPSSKLHALPRAPDQATIKASMLNASPLLGGGGGAGASAGGTGMRRMGSGQGASAFAGPMMSGARSPRLSPAPLDASGKMAPPSPVPAFGS